MLKSDLNPPPEGPRQNPVLHGVAAGLAKLFPPVERKVPRQPDTADAPREAEPQKRG